jgi:hypothetical protein
MTAIFTRRLSIVFAVLTLSLLSCTQSAGVSTIEDSYRISLERGACFGFCPIYKVEIHGDGTVIYIGERFVKVTGEQRRQISREAVAALVDKFVKSGFFNLEDEYVAQVTDLPTFVLTVSLSGQRKSIKDYGGKMAGMPAIVTELEDEVDRVAGTEKWVKTE